MCERSWFQWLSPSVSPIAHGLAFPNGGVPAGGEVEPVVDFQAEKRADGSRPQQRDKETGLLMWQCTVIDADDDANRKDIGVSVKFAAEVQPVPPKNTSPLPWTPVEFVGLTALRGSTTTGRVRVFSGRSGPRA